MKRNSYPSRTGLDLKDLDNIGIWINGNSEEAWEDTLESLISEKTWEIQEEIRKLEAEISRYHTKKVKGKIYWYKVENGKWKYIGKEDPTRELRKKVEKLKQRLNSVSKEIRSCVIKEAGDHLIVDISKLKSVAGSLPENLVKLSEILGGIYGKGKKM